MKKRKKEKKKKIAIATLMLVFVLVVVALVWIIYNPEAFLKLTGNAKKDKKVVEYSDIAFTSHDMADMEFALAGEVLTFPVTVHELEQAGYSMNSDDASRRVDGMSGMWYQTLSCSAQANEFNSRVSLSVANLEETGRFARDCVIRSISAKDAHFMLCNGISLASTYDEVISTMGEPDKYEEMGYAKELTYIYKTPDGDMEVYITFNQSSGPEKMDTLMLFDKSY